MTSPDKVSILIRSLKAYELARTERLAATPSDAPDDTRQKMQIILLMFEMFDEGGRHSARALQNFWTAYAEWNRTR